MANSLGDEPNQGGARPGDIVSRYGSAKHPNREVVHRRPQDMPDELLQALGKLSEALELVENARGHLYEFHRMSGQADLTLQKAVQGLRQVGQVAWADQIEAVLIGRDVVKDMWTFQLVEAYDTQYWSVFRAVCQLVMTQLAQGIPHLYEAEMKLREQA